MGLLLRGMEEKGETGKKGRGGEREGRNSP